MKRRIKERREKKECERMNGCGVQKIRNKRRKESVESKKSKRLRISEKEWVRISQRIKV